MTKLSRLYQHSLSLLTDLYQLTMAYGFWKNGLADTQAVFHLFFRKHPFQGGYTIAAGLEAALDYMEAFRFEDDDLSYLASLTGNDGKPLFEAGFIEHLRKLEFECTVDAVPEGTVVFPHEPMIRVQGPIMQCQLLETPLLNIVNFQSLIATKAARICHATLGEPVLEFGLRRAQGIDGALAASRAAHIGGCAATSNVLAGKLFGIPVRGTHAHSWVMFFDEELQAFNTYADAMPNNCVFLVDTYDTIKGVHHAVEVGKKLRSQGHEMVGIRLDSGDLAYLSAQARKILDEGGFPKASIVASNDLDEHIIHSLKAQGAQINVWGVGTKLATAFDQPALGGVYKLAALKKPGESEWTPRVKLSEQAIKVSNPGIQQVRRYWEGDHYLCDAIYEASDPLKRGCTIVDPVTPMRQRTIDSSMSFKDLLVPVIKEGKQVYDAPPVEEIRKVREADLDRFHKGLKRFMHPHEYPVGLERKLYERKMELIERARK